MNKNKILIVTSEFPPLPGGIGNHALNLAYYLQENKKEVTVITDQRELGDKEQSFDDKLLFKVHRIKLLKLRLLMYSSRIFKTIKLAYVNDVIIASGKFSIWIVGLISLFFPRKSFLAIVHGTEVNLSSNQLKKITDFTLKKIGNIVAVSNYTKSYIKHLSLKSLNVIPNGFSIDKLPLKPMLLNNQLNLVTVGRVSERKGQINVIQALPDIIKNYPKVCYHIIGIPQDKDIIIKEAKKLGVLEHLVFYGKIKNDLLYSIVSSSDIFLMLSQNDDKGDIEGFGIAILEANSFGIPAIGSIGCGIEDAIKNNYSGFLVNPKSTIDISNAVNKIMNNKNEFQQNSIEWSSKFTWDKIGIKYIDIINNLKL